MSLPPIAAASCRGSVFRSTGASRAKCRPSPLGATGGWTASGRLRALGAPSMRSAGGGRTVGGDSSASSAIRWVFKHLNVSESGNAGFPFSFLSIEEVFYVRKHRTQTNSARAGTFGQNQSVAPGSRRSYRSPPRRIHA